MYINSKILLVILFSIVAFACQRAPQPSGVQPADAKDQPKAVNQQQPTLEIAPLGQGNDQWKVIDSKKVKLTVSAPGAELVRVLYRPVVANDRQMEIRKLTAPGADGKFTHEFDVVKDFAGELWAEAHYANGEKRATQPIPVMADSIANHRAGEEKSADNALKPAFESSSHESERSDKITGGKIEKAAFVEGAGDIKITVNAPAFRLTLWQNGKEVKTYPIGIGQKDHPIIIGERQVREIIFNPDWVPPDSEWVEEEHKDVEPGERIKPNDPRNPLGKLKIPLGQGYLIHEANGPGDLGNLVSHGCIRMLTADLYDLVDKVIAARQLPVSREEIEAAKKTKKRLVVNLDEPLPVDINYDTQVVEGGVLHIYPDVYERDTNKPEALRNELESSGVRTARLNDEMLAQMLARANRKEEFVANVSDVAAGQALTNGRTQPLTEKSPAKKQQRSRRGTKKR